MKMNLAMQYSINNGVQIEIGGTTYIGRPPTYVPNPNGLGFAKLQKGIPYVNMDKLQKSQQ